MPASEDTAFHITCTLVALPAAAVTPTGAAGSGPLSPSSAPPHAPETSSASSAQNSAERRRGTGTSSPPRPGHHCNGPDQYGVAARSYQEGGHLGRGSGGLRMLNVFTAERPMRKREFVLVARAAVVAVPAPYGWPRGPGSSRARAPGPAPSGPLRWPHR